MSFGDDRDLYSGIFIGHGFTVVPSDILTAFNDKSIGSKVYDEQNFLKCVAEAMTEFDWNSCRIPGQAYIKLSKYACNFVGAGIGKRTKNPDDYVIRLHREEVGLYLHRSFAVKNVDDVAVVVYTLAAYLRDPDITEEETIRIKSLNSTHVLVAVLASSGQPSTLTPGRFVKNLSGGNLEALVWTADEIRNKAKEIKQYSSEWCTVAD